MRATRRDVLKAAAALSALALVPDDAALAQKKRALIRKPVPTTGEELPVIGVAAGRRYDIERDDEEWEALRQVLGGLRAHGATIVDTASYYGRAEAVVGELTAELGIAQSIFIATKLGAGQEEGGGRGRRGGRGNRDEREDEADDGRGDDVERSFRRLRRKRIDLIAARDLERASAQLAVLHELKRRGRIRYVGLATPFERQHLDLERTLRAESLDFIQVGYALDNRGAAERILPLAADRGLAVMVCLPFGRGRAFRAVQSRPLPDWAREFHCASWAQFFLKYVVSHPAVTCAVPSTAHPHRLEDYLGAARGALPTAEMRLRMEQYIDAI